MSQNLPKHLVFKFKFLIFFLFDLRSFWISMILMSCKRWQTLVLNIHTAFVNSIRRSWKFNRFLKNDFDHSLKILFKRVIQGLLFLFSLLNSFTSLRVELLNLWILEPLSFHWFKFLEKGVLIRWYCPLGVWMLCESKVDLIKRLIWVIERVMMTNWQRNVVINSFIILFDFEKLCIGS